MSARYSRTIFTRYAVAFAAIVSAFALAWALRHSWSTVSPFFIFYGAVAISSWFGGTGPGLVVTLAGVIGEALYLLEPHTGFSFADQNEIARIALFSIVGGLISFLNGALLRANIRCEREADAARKSEARVKRLAEANLIGVYFSDLRGTLRWANNEFLRLIGRNGEALEFQQINWLDVTAPEHRERDVEAINQLQANRACAPYEKDHLLDHGRRVPVLCGCAVVSDLDDVVGFVLDLTERKRAEAEARQLQLELNAMAAERMVVEERERRRIATVLHDSVVQLLALAKLKLDSLRRVAPGDGSTIPAPRQRISEIYDIIDNAVTQTRTLTAELSPPVLYELGLAAAIQWLGDRMERDHDVRFELRDDRRPKELSEEARIVLYQAVRELMTNVVKHAHATRCVVAIARDQDDSIGITVRDDGVGFRQPVTRDYRKGGFGLFNIRQRLAHLGGTLEIESPPEGGALVTIQTSLLPREKGLSREYQNSVSR
jgi:PAS domain S-box-containing protein